MASCCVGLEQGRDDVLRMHYGAAAALQAAVYCLLFGLSLAPRAARPRRNEQLQPAPCITRAPHTLLQPGLPFARQAQSKTSTPTIPTRGCQAWTCAAAAQAEAGERFPPWPGQGQAALIGTAHAPRAAAAGFDWAAHAPRHREHQRRQERPIRPWARGVPRHKARGTRAENWCGSRTKMRALLAPTAPRHARMQHERAGGTSSTQARTHAAGACRAGVPGKW